jgi:hypothetical protein
MAKERIQIPRSTRDAVLSEFNHRCAICGSDRPQLHHIDEDPSNNDPKNLIPLCPNCHLVDQHNPTHSLGTEKLKLFREFKDPTILKPQFHPLWTRMKFLDSIREDSDARELETKSEELTSFIAALEMGSFYSKQIHDLVNRPRHVVFSTGAPDEAARHRADQARREKEYREQLQRVHDEVHALVIELLRFQKWQ